jgi:tetratricopeptide (TPR) repeat protein
LKLGEPEQALSDFNTALRLDPDLGEAYLGRGNAYADLNELQQALKDYEHAVQLCPDSATALFNRATAYAELGDKTAAIRDFKQVQILLFDQGDTITLQKVLGRLLRLDAEIDADNFIVAEREQSGATAASAKRDEPSPLVQDKLLRLLKNDRAMAERLVAQARLQYPNRSERWYWEKVIWDVERDRFR